MLLRLDGLMQAIRIAASWHDTSGKLIHDQDLIILHHIILIPEHQVVGPQRQNNVVLDLNILRIRKILDLKEFLYFLNTVRRQSDDLVLFIYDEITGLCDLFSHDGGHFCHFTTGFTALHLSGQNVADFIKFG